MCFFGCVCTRARVCLCCFFSLFHVCVCVFSHVVFACSISGLLLCDLPCLLTHSDPHRAATAATATASGSVSAFRRADPLSLLPRFLENREFFFTLSMKRTGRGDEKRDKTHVS